MNPLCCPDCGTSFYGLDSVECRLGHKRVALDWWATCRCGHDAHYDMTGPCMEDDCECQSWTPSEQKRQLTRRFI